MRYDAHRHTTLPSRRRFDDPREAALAASDAAAAISAVRCVDARRGAAAAPAPLPPLPRAAQRPKRIFAIYIVSVHFYGR